ncbi:hypothetical protein Tco_0852036 [Tanacetum coccineum]
MSLRSLLQLGEFSVKSIRQVIDANCFPVIHSATRWVKSVHLKVNIMALENKKWMACPLEMNISVAEGSLGRYLLGSSGKNLNSGVRGIFYCLMGTVVPFFGAKERHEKIERLTTPVVVSFSLAPYITASAVENVGYMCTNGTTFSRANGCLTKCGAVHFLVSWSILLTCHHFLRIFENDTSPTARPFPALSMIGATSAMEVFKSLCSRATHGGRTMCNERFQNGRGHLALSCGRVGE